MKHLVISFVSEDRPGLVELLSNTIKQHQGNWQTSSMHHLSGYFAGVLEVAVAEEHHQELIDALNALSAFQLTIATASSTTEIVAQAVTLELTANDRPGIVQDISSAIHKQGGNLVKLVSTQQAAAHTGQTMFTAKAKIEVNQDDIDQMVEALEGLADDLMVDVSR